MGKHQTIKFQDFSKDTNFVALILSSFMLNSSLSAHIHMRQLKFKMKESGRKEVELGLDTLTY